MATAFRFPQDDLDNASALLGTMGTLWAELYEGNDVTTTYVYGLSTLERQAISDMREATACLSRYTTPVFHQERWQELILLQSQQDASRSILRYGDGARYGDGHAYAEVTGPDANAYPLAAAVCGVPMICNRITEPSAVLFTGIDYTIEPHSGVIVFRDDPFSSQQFATREVYDEAGVVVDYELAMWLYHGDVDRKVLFTNWGYQWGLELPSSATYKRFLNALWDAAVGGTAAKEVYGALTAAMDVPLALADETVELITTDARHLLVVTDQNVYRFNPAAVPLVQVGEAIQAGTALTDAVQYFECNRGQVPDAVQAVQLSRNFLVEGYYDGVTFINETVPVVVGSDGTFTTVRFKLGGWPLDVDKFWEDMHQRGLEAGQTLAHLLDQRANKVGEPTAANLPATINPLQFLLANVLRNHAFIVKVRMAAVGREAAPLAVLKILSRIIPPHTAMILLLELEAKTELFTMNAGRYVETPDTFTANEPGCEDFERGRINEHPELYYVDGLCI
jgi:hypothetical protein